MSSFLSSIPLIGSYFNSISSTSGLTALKVPVMRPSPIRPYQTLHQQQCADFTSKYVHENYEELKGNSIILVYINSTIPIEVYTCLDEVVKARPDISTHKFDTTYYMEYDLYVRCYCIPVASVSLQFKQLESLLNRHFRDTTEKYVEDHADTLHNYSVLVYTDADSPIKVYEHNKHSFGKHDFQYFYEYEFKGLTITCVRM